MKKVFILLLLFFFASSIFVSSNAQSAPDTRKSQHKEKKWFKKKEWLGGLKIQPHSSVNVHEFARQYQLNKAYWDKAFAFLKEKDLKTLPNGKYTIEGDQVFASVTENPTKNYDSTQWESHKKYIDIQYVIAGEERMGVNPVAQSTVTKSYNEAKDVANYSGEGKIYSATPEYFFIFFPTDAHRPNITPGGNKPDKKITIKVRYTE
ncbi:YhcH/YjgK/YiaL family protein [Chitinophagaceae bacterium LB-8]|uniref:YhcH/YjgK/YiaL family protein n=1 Tax=Paraflavisolibacter caeni TaxID=2982496 RepID=A0A9X2XNR5_9BACT|nr:YhcH/YjgK/YiaL family protein [Paraflavisolibacter caeni]MCU7548924.1 YhcH/YjgK/YiaL family protein [Paraflavisolibacter caeni]